MRPLVRWLPLILAAALSTAPASGQAPEAEATSLFGQPLVPPAPAPEVRARLDANLAAAQRTLDAAPSDPEAAIWVGRRLAYLGRYRDAIAVFTRGVERFPEDARFLRHRGHRYITTRQFEKAEADLARAAALVRGRLDEVEPDGQPNARNLPTSTLQFNIWYHLGLARYLRGDFAPAIQAYQECLKVSKNNDALVATSHWLYMTLRRLGRDAEARRVLDPITAGLDIIENASYHRLLLMYKGAITPDALLEQAAAGLERTTIAYGVGNWHYYHHRRSDAEAVWRPIVHGPQWAAFGSIAAEADQRRLDPTVKVPPERE
jgi:tetratricopeptide (TPR) repeat protein